MRAFLVSVLVISTLCVSCTASDVSSDAGTTNASDTSTPSADLGPDQALDRSDLGENDADGFDRVAWGREFPEAEDGIKRLRYSRYGGIVSCVEEGEYVGELEIVGNVLSGLVVTFPSGERDERSVERELTDEELAEVRTRVLAIPAKDIQMEHNCDPCVVSGLTIDGHSAGRACCGVCNPDFLPRFDHAAEYLQELVLVVGESN